MKMLNSHLLVEVEPEIKTESGLIIRLDNSSKYTEGTIVELPSSVEEVFQDDFNNLKVGQKILINSYCVSSSNLLRMNDKEYALVPISDVFAIL